MKQNFFTNKTFNTFNVLTFLPIVVLLIVTITPLIYTLYYSFLDWNLAKPQSIKFILFENYKNMFLDSLFYESLFNTFYQVFGTVAVQMIIGIPIALLLSRQLKYIKIIKSLYFLPFMMTPIVVGLVWRMLYSADHGIVNYFLESLFIEKQNWLGDYYLAMPAVIFVDIWLSTPFVVMLLIAGIFAIPEELYDAAKAEGGSDWQIFWFITFPLLTPILLLTVIFRIIDSFKRFDTIYIMTAGGPGTATETLNLHAYFHGFEYLNIGYASTISVTILIIVSIFSIYLANKLISSQSVY